MSQDCSEIRIDTPPPAEAAEEAARYWEFMRPSLEYGGMDYSEQELCEDLLAGDVLLIRIFKEQELVSVSAVRVRVSYGIRDLVVLVTAGSLMPEWIYLLDEVLVQIAKEASCDTISVQTREGMGRVAKKVGYRVHQIIIRKTVRPIQ